jgi:hypothetical protein
VDAFVLNFTANCPLALCSYLIDIYDDGGDNFSWVDGTTEQPVPNAYTQARVIVQTPIPAAVWLLGSALGVLGWARSRTLAG